MNPTKKNRRSMLLRLPPLDRSRRHSQRLTHRALQLGWRIRHLKPEGKVRAAGKVNVGSPSPEWKSENNNASISVEEHVSEVINVGMSTGR